MATATAVLRPMLLLILLVHRFHSGAVAQQGYNNDKQNDCYGTTTSSTVQGYTCNGNVSTCLSYAVFRSAPSYQSPLHIATLLNADADAVSYLNSLSSNATDVPAARLLAVPLSCSCSGGHYQHNASYSIQSGNTYQNIANGVYQGLTTCQALNAQNPFNSTNLTVGSPLVAPLRCACPTTSQIAAGAAYLLTYLVSDSDIVENIAARFRVSVQSVLAANKILDTDNIYAGTTLLIPLPAAPSVSDLASPPPAPSPATTEPSPSPPAGGSSGKGLFVGIGVGVGALVLVSACAAAIWWWVGRRRGGEDAVQEREEVEYGAVEKVVGKEFNEKEAGVPTPPSSVWSDEIRSAVESMVLYTYEEVGKATAWFAEDRRIKGGVFRGEINGDPAAVKQVKLADVAAGEIHVLRQISHANVIRLSGVCIHGGDAYLVYEFAENGPLSAWLHGEGGGGKNNHDGLTWKQRVRVANDVADALNYLHNFSQPPYVHKDLKSSSVLLDGELRAKVGGLGLARPTRSGGGESVNLTKHVVGTRGYMAPEYLEHGVVTPKMDVFAFGVIMLELISGRPPATEEEEEKGGPLLWRSIVGVIGGEDARRNVKEFVDPVLGDEYPFDLAFAMAELTAGCVRRDPASRPAMGEVVMALGAIYNSTLDWDPDYEAATTRSSLDGR